jgi:hypothetical protein
MNRRKHSGGATTGADRLAKGSKLSSPAISSRYDVYVIPRPSSSCVTDLDPAGTARSFRFIF